MTRTIPAGLSGAVRHVAWQQPEGIFVIAEVGTNHNRDMNMARPCDVTPGCGSGSR